MTEVWRLISMLQIAAVCSWLILTVSSLVPGTLPLSSRASSTLGHAALYFTAGAVTRAALPDVQSRWQIAAFLVAAAVFEVCQIWIPGRSAGVNDWVASSLGACLGVVVVRTVLHHDLVGWL